MSTQELRQQVESLGFKLERLEEKAHLNDIRERIARLDQEIGRLPQRVAKIRTRGFAFQKDLEQQVQNITEKWRTTLGEVQQEVTRQASRLKSRLPAVKMRLNKAQRTPRPADVQAADTQIRDLDEAIRVAATTITTRYSSIESLLRATSNRLTQIEWMLDQIDAAAFDLLAGESGIRACKAVWAQNGEEEQKDDPEGILYLTDQRILFEQKEEVATKKILFIATEKKQVQALRFEAPVAAVEDIREFDKGMLGKDDYLEIRFTSQAPRQRMVFHVWAAPKHWIQDIKRAQRRDFDSDRAIALDEEVIARTRNAPSECPSCGAVLGQAVLRGQDTLTCEYCGYVIRL